MTSLLQAPADHAVVLDVPDAFYLMLDGHGSPSSSPDFRTGIDALTDVADILAERMGGHAHAMPLEALWWWDDPSGPLPPDERDWMWRLMVRAPERASVADVRDAVREARARGVSALADRVRLDRYHEGRVLQIMHVGPYKTEIGTIERLRDEMHRQGYVPAGRHHEIYLGDPARDPPERLRTLLRQPVRWTDETQA